MSYLTMNDLSALADDCPPGMVPQQGPMGAFACVPASLATQPFKVGGPVQQAAAAWTGYAAPRSSAGSEEEDEDGMPEWLLAIMVLGVGYAGWRWLRRKKTTKRPAAGPAKP